MGRPWPVCASRKASSPCRRSPATSGPPWCSPSGRPASCSPRRPATTSASSGRFSAGPAGIQVWDGPFNGPNGTHGAARHLGSVDWSYDTPAKHYVTIYRVMVTQAGVDAGETTLSVLADVLALGGLAADGTRITLPAPPARDPFRRLAATGS